MKLSHDPYESTIFDLEENLKISHLCVMSLFLEISTICDLNWEADYFRLWDELSPDLDHCAAFVTIPQCLDNISISMEDGGLSWWSSVICCLTTSEYSSIDSALDEEHTCDATLEIGKEF